MGALILSIHAMCDSLGNAEVTSAETWRILESLRDTVVDSAAACVQRTHVSGTLRFCVEVVGERGGSYVCFLLETSRYLHPPNREAQSRGMLRGFKNRAVVMATGVSKREGRSALSQFANCGEKHGNSQ